MARTSQTDLAVLGALSVHPMTGYALRRSIQEVLGHFWSESFGQIYPTLAQLERDGLVERRSAERSAPFSITPAGLARLRERLVQPIQQTPPRNPLMLRLFFGRHLGVPECRRLVADARAEAEGQLAGFAAIRAGIDQERGTESDQPYWLLTVSAGEHAARATIAWADEALAELDRIEVAP